MLIPIIVLLLTVWGILSVYIYSTWNDADVYENERIGKASKIFYSIVFVPFFGICFLTALPILLWNRLRG